MKTQTPQRARNPQSKATKTSHATKVLREKKEKPIGERQKAHLLIQKYSDGEMQGFVSGIGHHESKRPYEKCASSPDFMDDFVCMANRFNQTSTSDSTQCLTITFQSFANGIKVSNRTAASEIYSQFIYLC